MDLLEMHPMARKMEQANKALTALEQGMAVLQSNTKRSTETIGLLLEDLQTEIFKAENAASKTGAKDIYVNGVAPFQFQKEDNYVPLTGNRLSGTVKADNLEATSDLQAEHLDDEVEFYDTAMHSIDECSHYKDENMDSDLALLKQENERLRATINNPKALPQDGFGFSSTLSIDLGFDTSC